MCFYVTALKLEEPPADPCNQSIDHFVEKHVPRRSLVFRADFGADFCGAMKYMWQGFVGFLARSLVVADNITWARDLVFGAGDSSFRFY